MTDNRAMTERIAAKLLENMERRLDAETAVEPKDYKNFTGALKELRELCRQDQAAADNVLTVRFEGEAEEMAK